MTNGGIASIVGALLAVAAAWIGWRDDTPERARAASEVDGAALFQAKGCATCHTGPASLAAVGDAFPSLADAAAWAGSRRAGMSAGDYVDESIREPWAFISPEFEPYGGPTTAMPDLGLSAAERAAIVDFLLDG
ncbi:MAG: c-type cytochrome [Ilumatobacteraceae bacterium]